MAKTPVVGVVANLKEADGNPLHAVGERYLQAIAWGAEAQAILIPVPEETQDLSALLDLVDGLFFTGDPSNVHPAEYDGAEPGPDMRLDRQRDAHALPLIRLALERALPLFAVCRGFQELNVALGGTLHARVHERTDALDHRADMSAPLDARYGLAHPVEVAPGGLLESLVPGPRFEVNSLHSQGVDRLAPPLRAEAHAPDGLVEAVSVAQAGAFALGVQWHPEWRVRDDPVSAALFAAFGRALRARRSEGAAQSARR